jgi:16S rRNA (guanine527-N7)-methyltransferase
LAPFADLCRLAQPLMNSKSIMLLLKGQDFVYEEQQASKSWVYDLVIQDSVSNPGGRIVTVRNLKRKS